MTQIQPQLKKRQAVKYHCRGHCLCDFPQYYRSKYKHTPMLRRKLVFQDFRDGWRWCGQCECGVPPQIIASFCPCCFRKLQFMPKANKYRDNHITRY